MTASSEARLPDTPLLSLTTAELFVVSSLRLWFQPLRHRGIATPDWQEGFVRAGLDAEAMTAFDMLMRTVGGLNRHGLDIRWQCCCRLGADEAVFLHCLSLMQGHHFDEAYAVVHDWLCPCGAHVAATLASRFAHALSDAGLILSVSAQKIAPEFTERSLRRFH